MIGNVVGVRRLKVNAPRVFGRTTMMMMEEKGNHRVHAVKRDQYRFAAAKKRRCEIGILYCTGLESGMLYTCPQSGPLQTGSGSNLEV